MPWIVVPNANGVMEMHWQMPNGQAHPAPNADLAHVGNTIGAYAEWRLTPQGKWQESYWIQPGGSTSYLPPAVAELQNIIYKHHTFLRAIEYVRYNEIEAENDGVGAQTPFRDVINNAHISDEVRERLRADNEAFAQDVAVLVDKLKQNPPLPGYEQALFGDAGFAGVLRGQVFLAYRTDIQKNPENRARAKWDLSSEEERSKALQGSFDVTVSDDGEIVFAPADEEDHWINPETGKPLEDAHPYKIYTVPPLVTMFSDQVLKKHAGFLKEMMAVLCEGQEDGNDYDVALDALFEGEFSDASEAVLDAFDDADERAYMDAGIQSFLRDVNAFKVNVRLNPDGIRLLSAAMQKAQAELVNIYGNDNERQPILDAFNERFAAQSREATWARKTDAERKNDIMGSLAVKISDTAGEIVFTLPVGATHWINPKTGVADTVKKVAHDGSAVNEPLVLPSLLVDFSEKILKKHTPFLKDLVAVLWQEKKAKGDSYDRALDALFDDSLSDALPTVSMAFDPKQNQGRHDYMVAGIQGLVKDIAAFKARLNVDGIALVDGAMQRAQQGVVNHFNKKKHRNPVVKTFVVEKDKTARVEKFSESLAANVGDDGRVAFAPEGNPYWTNPLSGQAQIGRLGRAYTVPAVVLDLQALLNKHASFSIVLMANLYRGKKNDNPNEAVYEAAIGVLKSGKTDLSAVHDAIKLLGNQPLQDYLHDGVIQFSMERQQLWSKYSSTDVEVLDACYKKYHVELANQAVQPGVRKKVLSIKDNPQQVALRHFGERKELEDYAVYGGQTSAIAQFAAFYSASALGKRDYSWKTEFEHAAGAIMEQAGIWDSPDVKQDQARKVQKKIAAVLEKEFSGFAFYPEKVQKLILAKTLEWAQSPAVGLFKRNHENNVFIDKIVYKTHVRPSNSELAQFLDKDVYNKSPATEEAQKYYVQAHQVFEKVKKARGGGSDKFSYQDIMQGIFAILKQTADILQINPSEFSEPLDVDAPPLPNGQLPEVPTFLDIIAKHIIVQAGKTRYGGVKQINAKYIDSTGLLEVVNRLVDVKSGNGSIYQFVNRVQGREEDEYPKTKEGRAELKRIAAVADAALDVVDAIVKTSGVREALLASPHFKTVMGSAVAQFKKVPEGDMPLMLYEVLLSIGGGVITVSIPAANPGDPDTNVPLKFTATPEQRDEALAFAKAQHTVGVDVTHSFGAREQQLKTRGSDSAVRFN